MQEVLIFFIEEVSLKWEFRLGIMAFFSNVFFQWKTTFFAYEKKKKAACFLAQPLTDGFSSACQFLNENAVALCALVSTKTSFPLEVLSGCHTTCDLLGHH